MAQFFLISEKSVMKNALYYCLPLALFFCCCNNSPDSEKRAKEANDAKIDSQRMEKHDSAAFALSKADADFLVEAASGGMMEVQLGQLAQTKSSDHQVKDFGALMTSDHGKGGEKLKALAISKNITLPDSISTGQQKEKEKLQKKKGEEFNRAYINMMVSDHKKDIREFEKTANNATNSDIKAFARNSLPMLYMHLDSAKNIQKRMGIKDMPEMPPPPYK
jgi:putative membrane protein